MNPAKPPTPEHLQRRRFSRRKLFLTLPGLAAGLLAGIAVAAESTTAEPAPLRVGVSPVFPPMVFKQAVIKATTGDFLVQREFPKAKRKTYASGEDAARALMRSSVDFFIADSTLVWYLAGTHAADGLTAIPFVLSEEFLAWGVRRGNDDLVAAANQFIERATKDGFLLKTFRRWMAME